MLSKNQFHGAIETFNVGLQDEYTTFTIGSGQWFKTEVERYKDVIELGLYTPDEEHPETKTHLHGVIFGYVCVRQIILEAFKQRATGMYSQDSLYSEVGRVARPLTLKDYKEFCLELNSMGLLQYCNIED